ncbi:hypothetical protein HHX47_DHR5000927 [Lentinula edodes]|nr:hypothetical protein HHX47_DHR5000927 [Lentinula edodes]
MIYSGASLIFTSYMSIHSSPFCIVRRSLELYRINCTFKIMALGAFFYVSAQSRLDSLKILETILKAVDVEPPTLYQLQHCCLSAIYLKGLGIRFAQEMGVHRKQKGRPMTVQSELWRRAFWVLLGLDVLVSINFGRPRATTDDDFDLEPPIECDDEYWENENPAQAFVQPPGVPSTTSFFICYAKLLEIAGLGHLFSKEAAHLEENRRLWL